MALTRYDTAPISSIHSDPQTGFLYAKNVPIARTGVFPYLKSDGAVSWEAKLPTELLADSTVESANGKPVTNDHPDELVTKDNAGKYMKGFTMSNAHTDGDTIRVDMEITDSDLIKAIQGGKQELSIGFQTDVEPVSGEYDGMHYDSVQKSIEINHVAVVERGRAGHNIRITGDSAAMVEDYVPQTGKKGPEMADYTKVYLGDSSVTVLDSDAEKVTKANQDLQSAKGANADKDKQIADLKKQIADLEAKLADLQGNKEDADKAKAEADSADKTIAALQEKLKSFEGDAFDKKVAERLELIEAVKPYLGDSYDFSGKSERDIKLDSIKADDADFDAEGKSDTYINAYFDAMRAHHKSTNVGYAGNVVHDTAGAKQENSALAKRNARFAGLYAKYNSNN